MRYCLFVVLFASALTADERFTTRLGTQGVDMFAGVQNTSTVIATSGPILRGGTNAVGGFRIKGGLNKYLTAYAEFAYSQLPSPRRGITNSIIDYGGGAEVHAPGWRVSPYLLGGIGAVRFGSGFGNDRSLSNSQFAGSLGGGLRVYVNKYWGFSAEVKAVKPIDVDWFQRYAVGIFLQFPPSRWPRW